MSFDAQSRPSNSPGEHFRCSWRVPPLILDKQSGVPIVRTHVHVPLPNEPPYGGQGGSGWATPVLRPEDGGKSKDGSESSSIRSTTSSKFDKSSIKAAAMADKKRGLATPSQASFDMSALRQAIPGPGDEVLPREPDAGVKDSEKVTVVFLCEQTSHHPPVSAAYYHCPERGIEAVGIDQIVAKVSFPCEFPLDHSSSEQRSTPHPSTSTDSPQPSAWAPVPRTRASLCASRATVPARAKSTRSPTLPHR